MPGAFARASAGFTLLEVLAVLALTAVATTIAAVTVHGAGHGRLSSATAHVATALRITRTRALATGTPQWLVWDGKRHALNAPGRDARIFPDRLRLSFPARNTDRLPRGTTGLGFFPDGSSTGGPVIVQQGTRKLRIDVDWLTGHVAVPPAGASE